MSTKKPFDERGASDNRPRVEGVGARIESTMLLDLWRRPRLTTKMIPITANTTPTTLCQSYVVFSTEEAVETDLLFPQ